MLIAIEIILTKFTICRGGCRLKIYETTEEISPKPALLERERGRVLYKYCLLGASFCRSTRPYRN